MSVQHEINMESLTEAVRNHLCKAMSQEVDLIVENAKVAVEQKIREDAAQVAIRLFTLKDFKMYQDKIVIEIVINRKELQ